VRLTGYTGVSDSRTVTMTGPTTLPVSGATVPDSSASTKRRFQCRAAGGLVVAGLSVRRGRSRTSGGAATVTDATPTVGTPTRLDIVLVPVSSGGFVPVLPTTAAVLDELTRRFPIPRSSISVSVRQEHVLSSVADGLDTQTEWSSALSELNQLRAAENPSNAYRYYFGFVRRSGGSVAGIGYVPGRTAGWDSANGWSRTTTHGSATRLAARAVRIRRSSIRAISRGGTLGTPLFDSFRRR
jgi:hypothetical protein